MQDEIYGSSYHSAWYIANKLKLPKEKNVYLIGMDGLSEELSDMGIGYVGGKDDDVNLKDFEEMTSILPDESIGCVLIAFDLHVNYKKMAKAFTYLHSNPECHFLVTNGDTTFPVGPAIYPETGIFGVSLASALGREATVLGKPHPSLLELINEK